MSISKFILILLLIFPFWCQGQNKNELQKRRENLLNQIKQTNKLLQQSESQEKNQLASLQLLNTKANQLEELVSALRSEVRQLNFEIEKNESLILHNETELNQLKKSYAANLVIAYKQKKTTNKWLLLLSSKSFNDAFRKLNYLKKWNEYRQSQAVEIRKTIILLEKTRASLLTDKEKKDQLLVEQNKQVDKMNENKEQIKLALSELKKEQEKYEIQLSKQKEESAELQRQIKAIIAAEIEAERKRQLALKKAEEERRKAELKNSASNTGANTKPTTFKAAPKKLELSDEFGKNKGKLPWPVSQGVMVNSLGVYGDESLPGIKRERDGIDIRTQANEVALSIFKGEVRSVTTIPGYNKVVIVSHGDYYTVYGKLQEVFVQPGNIVQEGDGIGRVETKDGISELHIQIWQGQNRLNPKDWIANK